MSKAAHYTRKKTKKTEPAQALAALVAYLTQEALLPKHVSGRNVRGGWSWEPVNENALF